MLTNREDRFANYRAAQERKDSSPQNRYMGGYNPLSSLSGSREETTDMQGPSRYRSGNRNEVLAGSSPRPMAPPLRQRQSQPYYASDMFQQPDRMQEQPEQALNTYQRTTPNTYQRPTRSRSMSRSYGGNLRTDLMRQPDNTFQGDINDYR